MGQRQSQITKRDKAVLDLKVQRDKLRSYKKKLVNVTEREHQIAKELYQRGEKQKALLALKKKKYQEKLLDQVENQLLTLEQLTSSIEYAAVELEVISGLKKGTEVLNELNKEMSLQNVEKLMDDTADAIQYQNEVNELISGTITIEDEDEIQKELEALLQMQADEDALKMPKAPLTKVPETLAEGVIKTETGPTKVKSKQNANDPIAA